MTYVLDPFSAGVAGWTLLGKAIEQQLRVGTAVQQAMLASFGLSSPSKSESTQSTSSNFVSQRAESDPAKAKTAPRKAAAKPKPVARKAATPKKNKARCKNINRKQDANCTDQGRKT